MDPSWVLNLHNQLMLPAFFISASLSSHLFRSGPCVVASPVGLPQCPVRRGKSGERDPKIYQIGKPHSEVSRHLGGILGALENMQHGEKTDFVMFYLQRGKWLLLSHALMV